MSVRWHSSIKYTKSVEPLIFFYCCRTVVLKVPCRFTKYFVFETFAQFPAVFLWVCQLTVTFSFDSRLISCTNVTHRDFNFNFIFVVLLWGMDSFYVDSNKWTNIIYIYVCVRLMGREIWCCRETNVSRAIEVNNEIIKNLLTLKVVSKSNINHIFTMQLQSCLVHSYGLIAWLPWSVLMREL